MARIVINTIGSTGDLFPFIALGQALKLRGHSIVFAVNSRMHPTLQKTGLDAVSCGAELGEDEAHAYLAFFDGSNPLRQIRLLMLEWLIPSTQKCYNDLLPICKGADALIATSIQFAAPMLREKLGLHWISVSLTPSQFPTAYDAPIRFPHTGVRWINRAAWALTKGIVRWNFLPELNRMRAKMGFAPVKEAPSLGGFSQELTLLASSRHFSPAQPDWEPCIKQTGYWFYDAQDQAGWQPSAELREFVEHGAKPIVLSLGSMVQKDPQGVVRMHAEAAARLKQRLIVQQGWAKLRVDGLNLPLAAGDVTGAGFLPHEWLFSHARAVIHHGGAGTTARALRNGCPMLLEPHGFDQPYNARRVRQLGAGDAIDAHRVTVSRLERALSVVLSDETKQKVTVLSEKIRAEDGVAEACALIEPVLAGGA